MVELLSFNEATACAGKAGWVVEGGEIVREWKFSAFRTAIRFVDAVAALAEAADHHPDIDIRLNRVRLRLCTHSAGGLTARDFDLATAINAAAGPLTPE